MLTYTMYIQCIYFYWTIYTTDSSVHCHFSLSVDYQDRIYFSLYWLSFYYLSSFFQFLPQLNFFCHYSIENLYNLKSTTVYIDLSVSSVNHYIILYKIFTPNFYI